jgi:hypothetical protein
MTGTVIQIYAVTSPVLSLVIHLLLIAFVSFVFILLSGVVGLILKQVINHGRCIACRRRSYTAYVKGYCKTCLAEDAAQTYESECCVPYQTDERTESRTQEVLAPVAQLKFRVRP